LHIPGVRSLKEKRRIIKSLKERLRNQYNVSAAEVGALDSWQRSELAFVCVGNDNSRIHRVLSTLMDRIRSEPSVSVIDYHTELF
jgi:uncharacterized protein